MFDLIDDVLDVIDRVLKHSDDLGNRAAVIPDLKAGVAHFIDELRDPIRRLWNVTVRVPDVIGPPWDVVTAVRDVS